MNSLETLDFAIARLDKVRTPRLELAQQFEEAITTLRALRGWLLSPEGGTRPQVSSDIALLTCPVCQSVFVSGRFEPGLEYD